jgi:hypothetical protein
MSIEKRLTALEKRLGANSEENRPITLLVVGYEIDAPPTQAEKEEALRRYYEEHPEHRGTFFIIRRDQDGIVRAKSAFDLARGPGEE